VYPITNPKLTGPVSAATHHSASAISEIVLKNFMLARCFWCFFGVLERGGAQVQAKYSEWWMVGLRPGLFCCYHLDHCVLSLRKKLMHSDGSRKVIIESDLTLSCSCGCGRNWQYRYFAGLIGPAAGYGPGDNNSVTTVTGLSPFYANYGFHPRTSWPVELEAMNPTGRNYTHWKVSVHTFCKKALK
jgi:hypothetical protein